MDIPAISETTNYRIIRKLAEGGMGAVYEAKLQGAEGFEKTVAIKSILENYTGNPEFVRLFIGEAKLVADLVHENIVQVYQLGRTAQMYYIALEFVEGINLEQFIEYHYPPDGGEKKVLDVDLGAFIISRVCRGLEYAHNKRGRDGVLLGIVHRDVSPKNIMLNREGILKLTDFGIAKARTVMEQEEGEVLMGKVEYMSPEQALYQETDRRSDLFSMGIVAFELLTGQHIFETDDIYETLNNVKKKRIPDIREIRPDVPEDLAKILAKALERDLTKRFQTAGEMGYALEYYMYHNRFGPTNVTMGNYLKKHFFGENSDALDKNRSGNPVVGQRSDTLFGDLLKGETTQL